jgi:hypothetical protein
MSASQRRISVPRSPVRSESSVCGHPPARLPVGAPTRVTSRGATALSAGAICGCHGCRRQEGPDDERRLGGLMSLLAIAVRIIIAVLLGGVIGLERQWRQRGAGLRTNALVSTGAAAFVALSALIPGESSPTRIAAQVVSGIGFLGSRRHSPRRAEYQGHEHCRNSVVLRCGGGACRLRLLGGGHSHHGRRGHDQHGVETTGSSDRAAPDQRRRSRDVLQGHGVLPRAGRAPCSSAASSSSHDGCPHVAVPSE